MVLMFDDTVRKAMTLTATPRGLSRTPLILAAATAALLAMGAQAQTPAAASQLQPAPPAAVVSTAAAAAAPKYTAKDIDRAFGFIDGNRDGKISREEAAGFRGVARHFDEADSNKDQVLSREEFESALNR